MKLNPILRSIRAMVLDVAYAFRMGAGFPGDVNRTHPVSIEPALQNVLTPSTAYGQPMVADTVGATNTVRRLGAGDAALVDIYGVSVRPFPIQDTGTAGATGAVAIGAATPPPTGIIDVMRSGYIMVQMNLGFGAVTKGAPVFIWVAATAGAHIQGQYEPVAAGGNTASLAAAKYSYNGPADSAGVVEIAVNP